MSRANLSQLVAKPPEFRKPYGGVSVWFVAIGVASDRPRHDEFVAVRVQRDGVIAWRNRIAQNRSAPSAELVGRLRRRGRLAQVPHDAVNAWLARPLQLSDEGPRHVRDLNGHIARRLQ